MEIKTFLNIAEALSELLIKRAGMEARHAREREAIAKEEMKLQTQLHMLAVTQQN